MKSFIIRKLHHSLTVIPALLLTACGWMEKINTSTDSSNDHDHVHLKSGLIDPADTGSDEAMYQCSMHPNVIDDQPGSCPICGMELQPVEPIQAKGIPGRAPVKLTNLQEQLINIRTASVENRPVSLSIRARGVIEHDQSRVFTVSAWTAGRIEKLHVDEEEADIRKGDPLYSIYSPILYAAMQEYIDLRKGLFRESDLLESARIRMKQLGLSEEQIEDLDATDKAPVVIDIPSPVSGKVMTKKIREGDYVEEGDSLYTVIDLSRLWLMTEVYEFELPFISPGQQIVATTPAVPNVQFFGTISLVNHHIDPSTRTARLRVLFDDPKQIMTRGVGSDGRNHHEHRLLPDMWMTVHIEKDLGTRLVIPRSAVFDTGSTQYVFVQEKKGLFVPKVIKIGPVTESGVVVEEGLETGQRVVTDGTFLLDSESQLKATASAAVSAAPWDADMDVDDSRYAHPLPSEGEIGAKQ